MKNNIVKILFFIVSLNFVHAQNNQRNPLDYKSILSGTFGELRTNHFHSGIDIKTKGKEGSKVYAFSKGYVSRIKISKGGYGKAIYIKHNDGKTTVYAHLKRFSKKIETIVKNEQYRKENYEIEIFPAFNEIKISDNELIAYSGNTGGSSGPHLHFEIRDINQKPLNPLNYGINVQDSKTPSILGLKLYSLYKNREIKSSKNLTFYKKDINTYITDTIHSIGTLGFGIQTIDRQDLANNKNGVYKIDTYINNDTLISIDFSKFSFEETKHINRYIDYSEFKRNKKRFQKLFIQKNNPLSIYKKESNQGVISLIESSEYLIKIEVTDFNRNLTKLLIPIKGNKNKNIFNNESDIKIGNYKNLFINRNKKYILNQHNSSLYIEKETFYNNLPVKVDDPMAIVFRDAMESLLKKKSKNNLSERMSTFLEVGIEKQMNKIDKGFTFLATVGSTAPFIGLFGTVWGIMNSFQSIAISRNTSLAIVAPGIAEALFATALGLLAAIPAVVAYNKFNTDSQKYSQKLENFSKRFLTII